MSSETNLTPRHVGFILDGNRRWATNQGLPTLEGHRKGSERFKEIALACLDAGVEYVSAYIFSSENWARTEEEVGYLMNLVIKVAETQLGEFKKRGVRIVVLGSHAGLSDKVLEAIDKTTSETKDNTNGTIALCFNYGGKQEIADAANQVCSAGKPITVDSITSSLYHSEVPDIDLLIRTSGERRLSGYMLWRSDYAELYFTECMWPDFNKDELNKALAEYQARQRRFGS